MLATLIICDILRYSFNELVSAYIKSQTIISQKEVANEAWNIVWTRYCLNGFLVN